MITAEAGWISSAFRKNWVSVITPAFNRGKLLAEAIKKVMSSHDLYSAEARLRAVRNFDVKPWLSRHNKIFRSIISGVNT